MSPAEDSLAPIAQNQTFCMALAIDAQSKSAPLALRAGAAPFRVECSEKTVPGA